MTDDLYTLQPRQIVMYAVDWCPDCKRAKIFMERQQIQYLMVNVDEDPQGASFIKEVNHGNRSVPTIVFPDGSTLSEPSNAQLAEKLGLRTKADRSFYDVIVIGGGPAGLTAAIYLTREDLETLVIEKSALGGQAGTTEKMDNFPGFDEGISGAEFAERLARQARRFGAELLEAQDVTEISREGRYFCVTTADGSQYGAKAILFSAGARYRRMNVPGEDGLIGVNVHFCATCDGAFYKDKKVLVVGGGNSGFEEGLFLTKFAKQVDIVEFLPQVKASAILQQKIAEQPNMRVTVNHAIKELVGKNKLEKILVEDRATGEIKEWSYDGIFVFIGLTPNSDLVKNLAEVDKFGFVATDKGYMTSIPGLFAAGDVRAGSSKQAAVAVGEGASAALAIREYLKEAG